MPELQRLHPGHAPAVLAFELANRSYFAAFISDRGDEFFDQFTEQYRALLAQQEAGALTRATGSASSCGFGSQKPARLSRSPFIIPNQPVPSPVSTFRRARKPDLPPASVPGA